MPDQAEQKINEGFLIQETFFCFSSLKERYLCRAIRA